MTSKARGRSRKSDPLPKAVSFDALAAAAICANCFQVGSAEKLFCAQRCIDEASWVRYVRARRAEGRDREPDIVEAIRVKLVRALAGGYSKARRRLSQTVRSAVLQRDQGRCRSCGGPGEDIDHISGDSSALSNLQLLCKSCHNKKTTARFVRMTPESHPQAWARAQALRLRVESLEPLQLCDSDSWPELQKKLISHRRAALGVGGPRLF